MENNDIWINFDSLQHSITKACKLLKYCSIWGGLSNLQHMPTTEYSIAVKRNQTQRCAMSDNDDLSMQWLKDDLFKP